MRRIALGVAMVAAVAAGAYPQGRTAPDWTTQGADAQRTSWIAADPWISAGSMSKFRLLWQIRLDNESRQTSSLTAPVGLANLMTFRGFKSLAFVGGSSNNVYAVDYDFGTLFWKTHFNYASGIPEFSGSPACPGGMTSPLTRPTSLVPSTQLGFLGFARPPRSARGEVGEPGKGSPLLPADAGRGRGAPAARGDTPAASAPARGGALAPAPARGRGPNVVFALAGDGLLRALNSHTGETAAASARMVPPNSTASGLLFADGTIYAVTSHGCGSAPDAIWAMDWSSEEKPVATWKSSGASISSPSLMVDGSVVVATGRGESAYASSVVALEARTLGLKNWFTSPGVQFNSTPTIFTERNRTYVAAAGDDGRIYVLDAEALGGPDHKTPLTVSSADAKPSPTADGLATWRDDAGTRWILTATSAGITAFKLVGAGLERIWVSPTRTPARTPMVINGVVFVLSAGQSGGASTVLSALNPSTGAEIWSSGNAITSSASSGLAAGNGQVYIVTSDNTLWAFGIPQVY